MDQPDLYRTFSPSEIERRAYIENWDIYSVISSFGIDQASEVEFLEGTVQVLKSREKTLKSEIEKLGSELSLFLGIKDPGPLLPELTPLPKKREDYD